MICLYLSTFWKKSNKLQLSDIPAEAQMHIGKQNPLLTHLACEQGILYCLVQIFAIAGDGFLIPVEGILLQAI